ncbi:MAG: glycosyltransferase [Gammaproteobacteria bacterium]|nr:glycosyltransferase [Gammaproteobacteria bacterium]
MNIAVIVPTLNAGTAWQHWIAALLVTDKDVSDVYIIDSGSSDDTILQSVNAGFNVKKIQPVTFNHGGTRQLAVADLADYDVAVFLTQDAILRDSGSFESILEPFEDDEVAAVCGRQLPRKQATQIEAHARLYNYSSNSFTRSINDVARFGLKTAFISNSFSAYRVSTLNEVGGFPDDVIFGEDMFVATRLLKAGYKIAYAADACVYHSHNYTLWQEMKRYFDMGVFHSREPWIRQELGGAEGEGLKFVISEMKYLLENALWSIPEGILRTILRYMGFRLGLMEKKLPFWLKKRLVMNHGYFKSL